MTPFILATVSLLMLMVGVVSAQSAEPQAVSRPPQTSTTKTVKAEEQQQRLRRGQARSLLIALAMDARNFNDPSLRARSLARIADVLWQVDVDQARVMFRKAWEAAEIADKESDAKVQVDIQEQQARTGGGYVLSLPPDLRREVLELATRRDGTLGDEFLEKLRAQKAEAVKNKSSIRTRDGVSDRLNIAREMFLKADIESALQFADSVLNTVTMETLTFLVEARHLATTPADMRYARLLKIAADNPESDPNTVSLLASYIFTPNFFITFSDGGGSTHQTSGRTTPEIVPVELRMAFYHTAVSILSRPFSPTGTTREGPGFQGKYLVIKRILPFFEQGAPSVMIDSLRSQLNALASLVSDETRSREPQPDKQDSTFEKVAAEQEQAFLDRIDRAGNTTERDSLLGQLALHLVQRGDLRARDYASRIDDSELRKNAQGYVDASLSRSLIGKQSVDEALEIATRGELTHLQRAWVMVECAKILFKTDRQKSLDLIETATSEARRMDVSDPYLPRALLSIANAVLLIDKQRSWDAAFDAIKAANSAETFTGEDGQLTIQFKSKQQTSISSVNVPDFNVEGLFRQLALRDYDRAVELARGFQAEGPRALATIAIARAVLNEKKAPADVKK